MSKKSPRRTPRKRIQFASPLTPLSGPAYHAVVIDTGFGYKIRPGVTQVNGQTNPFFRVKNNTGNEAWLLLPPSIVVGGAPAVEVPSHSWVEVPLQGGGAFSYVVVLRTEHGIVSVPGESDPVIIIDPPARRSR